MVVDDRSIRGEWINTFNLSKMIYKHGKHEIELFDSIHNLPILRFQRFNKYQMQSVEIGNTFEDYDRRMVKALQFIQKGMKDEALLELENQRQTVFNSFNEFTPHGKTFAILVKRIDDKYYNTFAPDDLNRCLEHLEQIGMGFANSMETLKEVKKKSKPNWWSIIQTSFQRTETKNIQS